MESYDANVLVSAETAAWVLRASVDDVYEMADGGNTVHGSLIWAFDLSVQGETGTNRNLRFYTGELIGRGFGLNQAIKRFTLERVTDGILPRAVVNFQSGRVEKIFGISGSSLMRLREQMGGNRAANTSFFPRQDLVNFLTSRWLGKISTTKIST